MNPRTTAIVTGFGFVFTYLLMYAGWAKVAMDQRYFWARVGVSLLVYLITRFIVLVCLEQTADLIATTTLQSLREKKP